MVRPTASALLASLFALGIGVASAAPAPHGDDRLWLGVGTAANPLVHGAPKYCTANQHVAAWNAEDCHYARLAWAERHPVAQAHPAAPTHPRAQAARVAVSAPSHPTPRPTETPDDAQPGEEFVPTAAPVAMEPLPEPTRTPAPADVRTAPARPTRPSYATGPDNPMWRRMAGGAPAPRTPTSAPVAVAEETEPPESAPAAEPPRTVARASTPESADAGGSDMSTVRYTPSTRFAWNASKTFSACFGSGGGTEPLGALTAALAAHDTPAAVEDASHVYTAARPCDRTDAASAVGVSELAVLQSYLYAERNFWTYADLKLRLAQTELDAASHRDGFTAIDAARIDRIRATIASLKSVIATHPE